MICRGLLAIILILPFPSSMTALKALSSILVNYIARTGAGKIYMHIYYGYTVTTSTSIPSCSTTGNLPLLSAVDNIEDKIIIGLTCILVFIFHMSLLPPTLCCLSYKLVLHRSFSNNTNRHQGEKTIYNYVFSSVFYNKPSAFYGVGLPMSL